MYFLTNLFFFGYMLKGRSVYTQPKFDESRSSSRFTDPHNQTLSQSQFQCKFFFLIDLFLKIYLFFSVVLGFLLVIFFLKFQIHDLGLWVFLKLDIGSCVTLILLCFLCWVVKNMLKFGSLGFRIIGFSWNEAWSVCWIV